MKQTTAFLILLFILNLSFAQKHFITNESYRDTVEVKYQALSKSISPEVFQEIEAGAKGLNQEQKEAYQFLYAYMPLSDLADFSPRQFAEFVKQTIIVRSNMTWGKTIPEDVFRHFVLPIRVNNENLDYSRIFFYSQLKDRVKDMDMLQAALEVNHWCHEHVAYQASDSRTSSPLTTYLNGYGRCGEESTFTVAALRSVGIPARQVYTPRWAHTDDNHAWVEFWANGKWHFYGACEPVPEANMGWFTEPARRAMLVNTRVIGKYQGSERILIDKGNFSILNTLNVYSETKILYAKITDTLGKPIENAKVDFQLYNYGEYYTIAPKTTNKEGITSFETGMGSLLVWAHKGSYFNWKNISLLNTDTVYLTLNKKAGKEYLEDFKYFPPVKPEPRKVSADGKAENSKRMKEEDLMRAEYEKTFMDSVQCQAMAQRNSLDFDELWPIMQYSRANWKTIMEFVDQAPNDRKQMALDLLKVIATKDLHDTKIPILNDHLLNTPKFLNSGIKNKEIYDKYLLNPRISLEYLSPWRGFIQENIAKNKYKTWIDRNVQINNQLNFYRVLISPEGIYKTRKSDKKSADHMRVALFRSNGVPARLEPGTLKPEYYAKGEWKKMSGDIKTLLPVESQLGYLQLQNPDKAEKLLYYKHFTLAQFRNGQYYTLEYDWDKNINDFNTLKLPAGNYRLTTGNRIAGGSVLVHFDFFNIQTNDTINVNVQLRKQENAVEVIGKMPMIRIKLLHDVEKPKACSTEPVYQIYVWYQPNNEPSKHAVQDLGAVKDKLESQNITLKLISETKIDISKLDKNYFGNLPSTARFLFDPELKYLAEIEKSLGKKMGSEFPYIILVNPKNEIIYFHEGYSIGIGEEILKLVR